MSKNLLQSFRDFVARENLFTHDDKLLLACSGGLDSTVLAHLLHAEGYDFGVAHMNFQLRGEDSDGDAAFVANLAQSLGAKFWTKAVDVKAEAQDGESTQMTCRRLRYDWFDQLKWKQPFTCVLTAHHLDDSLETFLMQLIRGSNYSGPGAISAASAHYRRPLLNSSRETIADYAGQQNITWREDASNATDDYLRNRVRHKLTPLLRREFGHTTAKWSKTQEQLRMDNRLIELGKKTLREQFTVKDGKSTSILREGNEYLPEMVRDLAAIRGFSPEQRRQILAAKGNTTFSSGRWLAVVTPESVRFDLTEGLMQSILEEEIISRLPHHNEWVSLELIPRPGSLDEAGVLYLAPPSFPLHLRPRQNGDRFRPLGLHGRTKKVKDYMIDAKIPVWLRDRIYLLTDANDEIMAISGYCISEKFKVLPEHEEVLRISWT